MERKKAAELRAKTKNIMSSLFDTDDDPAGGSLFAGIGGAGSGGGGGSLFAADEDSQKKSGGSGRAQTSVSPDPHTSQVAQRTTPSSSPLFADCPPVKREGSGGSGSDSLFGEIPLPGGGRDEPLGRTAAASTSPLFGDSLLDSGSASGGAPAAPAKTMADPFSDLGVVESKGGGGGAPPLENVDL